MQSICLLSILSTTPNWFSLRIAGKAWKGPFCGAAERFWRGGIVQNPLQHGHGGRDAALAAKLRCHDARRWGRRCVAEARNKRGIKPFPTDVRVECRDIGEGAERGGGDNGSRLAGGIKERGAA